MQEAAKLRDKIRDVVQQNLDSAKQRTTSDTVTDGIRVQVKRCKCQLLRLRKNRLQLSCRQ